MTTEDRIDLTEPLFDFIKATQSITDIKDLNNSFEDIASFYGYKNFICTEIIGSHKFSEPENLFGKLNEGWERRYFNKQFYRFDDCLRHLKNATANFSWTDVRQGGESTSLGVRIMNEAGDFRCREGLLIPIRSFDGRMSVVSLMGEHVDLSEKARIALEVAAIYFTETGVRLKSSSDSERLSSLLTPRQVEILKWLSVGKRNADISDILGISVKTIDRHLEDARQRLNVLTTNQLLVTAYIKGQIVP